MTSPKVIRNKYCCDPEDRVIAWSCLCCTSCWLYVASRPFRNREGALCDKNGTCVFGGPFGGYEKAANPVSE